MNNLEPWEKYQLKEKALKYYQENKVPEKMEKVLNIMFCEKPTDVYGYLSDYFEAYAYPVTIHKVQAYPALDSKGGATLGIDIHCMVKNRRKFITSMIFAGNETQIWDDFKIKDLIEEKQKKNEAIEMAVKYINENLGTQLNEKPILDCQLRTDTIIKEFFDVLILEAEEKKRQAEAEIEAATVVESQTMDISVAEADRGSVAKKPASKKSAKGPKAKVDITLPPNDPPIEWLLGSQAGSSLSQAVCATEASIKEVLLFEHIASLVENDKVPTSYRLPLPMVTLMHCGKSSAGKVHAFKEVMLIPSCHFSMKECVHHLLDIKDHLLTYITEHHMKQIYCVNKVSDVGAITVQFDRAEQVIDLVIDAIETAGFKPGEDFSLGINCASHEIIDAEKGRYEFLVPSNLKSMEDTVDFWIDLVKSYPSIVVLIDPLRRKEGKHWLHLCEAISNHCLIVGDYYLTLPDENRPKVKEIKSLVKKESVMDMQQVGDALEQAFETFTFSGQVFRLQQHPTVSDFIKSVKLFKKDGSYAVCSVNEGGGTETFLADLAVALKCQFIKIGGLSRGERFQYLNRLIYIEQYLMETDQLERDTTHWTFPKLVIEKLQPLEEEE